MSVVTARGKKAKESATKKNLNIDFKKIFIRLKDGDSVRVRILSAEDYVEYLAHGNYNLGIFTQPCNKPAGNPCAMCEAGNSGEEGWEAIKARKRYLFAFADIDDGSIRVFDATKGQATGLIDTIEQYAEDIEGVAFTFKRTGNKTETAYTLNPILKLKPADKEKFDKFDGAMVEDEFFETVLQARSFEQQVEELKKNGFPVNNHFDVQMEENTEDNEGVKPIEEGDQTEVF